MPGYGFSGEPTEIGWDPGRIARAWAELMARLGYDRYVAQGGDEGAHVTDAMGRQAPDGLLGIHLNLLAAFPPAVAAVLAAGPCRRGSPSEERAAFDTSLAVCKVAAFATSASDHAAADGRLRPAGFARRARGLDARPRPDSYANLRASSTSPGGLTRETSSTTSRCTG